ncbi:hypothetical protein [Bradyrhizobium sp. Tv2a-2]|uniref:hypothetical protein n=1 Tax=Bradyrhizobium sp. Tv2a-2 TaxID=113395 RepID=UPI0003F63E15|nr:hypothetical protein [Bradyrhizobium sp. Tv2a-2]
MSNDTIKNAKPVHHELSEFELDIVSGGGGGVLREGSHPEISDITITKKLDVASPRL